MKRRQKNDGVPTALLPSMDVNRREFLRTMGLLGGGVVIYFTLGDAIPSTAQAQGHGGGEGTPTDFNAFFRFGPDERVKCFIGKVDMGQGTITSFPQIVAEELDVPYGSIDLIMGDTDVCPYDFGTVGSMAIRIHGVIVRNAACEAKVVLKELAADFLQCSAENLRTKDGVVFNPTDPNKKVTYGALAKGRVIEKHVKEPPPLKSPSEFTVLNKPYFHQDARDKVTGRAKFAGDIRLPGMLYAGILRPPAHGATLKSLDLSEAKKLTGVRVVQENDLVAVLHARPDEAQKALGAIKAEYEMPETGLNDKTIHDHFLSTSIKPNVSQGGDLEAGTELADDIFEETYLSAYVAHTPMETHTGIAQVDNGKVTVWSSTQTPFPLQESIVETLGLAKEKVRVITPFVGGGFGGKGSPNPNKESREAARLAMLTGKPVQVAHTRAEEFFLDTFRPAAAIKIKSGLDGSGNIVLWDYHVYMAGSRCSEVLYEVPHYRVSVYGSGMFDREGVHPFGIGPWRAPGAGNNIHAKELQMSIMAAKAGIDPLTFRLKHLKDERMVGVLKAVADKFGYTPSNLPSGRGYGMSCAVDANTYVAHMAEVDVDKGSGKIEVRRIVVGYDMGLCVNPQGTRLQMEGCCVMGMGYALTEGLQFSDGVIFDRNFDTYNIPRFSWLPKIETLIVNNNDFPPQGGGEPAVVGIGAVIATGVFDATGARLFNMPMTRERVIAAVAKVS